MSESIVYQKAYLFSIEIVKLNKYLSTEKKEFVLSKQVLRSGTSVGANVNEAVSNESKRDFVHKMGIALKEARETEYWPNLLKDSDYISTEQFSLLDALCMSLIKILSSIILTTEERYFKKQSTHNP